MCVMWITVRVDRPVMLRIEELAEKRGTTVSAVVDDLLRRGLDARVQSLARAEWPTYRMGRSKADLADRDALDAVMERAD